MHKLIITKKSGKTLARDFTSISTAKKYKSMAVRNMNFYRVFGGDEDPIVNVELINK